MKMNMKKPVLSLALFLAALLLFAGCGKNAADIDSSSAEAAAENEAAFTFSTVDIEGNAVDMSDYGDAKVIMVNLWEPWCPPCKAEIPDIQKLYDEYKDEGFVVLGVYSSDDHGSAEEVVREYSITYPILRSTDSFAAFETQYVPTTFFVDGSGNVISDESYIGAKSYEEWESIVLSYLS